METCDWYPQGVSLSSNRMEPCLRKRAAFPRVQHLACCGLPVLARVACAQSPEPSENVNTTETQRLAQVTVTAERRPADSQTVPLSIATLTREDLRARGMQGTDDLGSAIPGLEFNRQGIGA